ncbi:MAG TPA: PHP domain-containing protein [Chloroflexota bacterium]|nr:PHP domain-containing protein [Chloroflexota bacterium]
MTDTPALPRHLRSDLHLHSRFSDGRADVETMVLTAQRIGFEIAISDHYSVYFGMKGDETLGRYLDALEQFPIYRAVELDLGQEQAISEENRARLDYCVGSMHMVVDENGDRVKPDAQSPASLRRYMECATAQFARGLRSGIPAMIGHPTYLPDLPREGQDALWTPEFRKVIVDVAVETGIALEISTRYKTPMPELARELLAAGARFAVASDGHGPEAIGAIDYPRRLIAELGIPDDRFFLPERRLPANL